MKKRCATRNRLERQPLMAPTRFPHRAVLCAIAFALLAGCANKDRLATGALPDDYRTRHPIVLTEGERTIDIPVASGDTRLTQGTRDVIRGFAAEYRNASSGVVQIMLPRGSVNGRAAQILRKEIRRLLAGSGVSPKKIIETSYDASVTGDAAPIRLSYVAITAQTAPCGAWPEDLALNTLENRNYYNFGCATQSNLAAQIANPTDLVGPRRMSPIDAEQRGQVIDSWRGTEKGDGGTTIVFN
ncbi:pilus assembly protein CpaD [Sinorhizobium medicae]|uniref:Pilus (Caulobacter type) biogenesis lipoprotein CpaD n=4 Tax=Sinorhizobium medicae TaxID=110321 RepID=A6UEU4_SINMW|nr:pilus (Caulobacter type) biogenesis lipoprotein CpaD [Sinorhizobium medicae WSM419]MDX0405943.1 pilus assembly protein CpaD [Sinorhizobium medicae]MDX0411504.1 pilus assembly protein CpaD [Sinorhizobium medicae]MDX0418251.1 pilus assembly protein CpaD [Sinorhizobium medicae]MDX0430589.1 pilus assembly protein CpaD [Sinorhizobium medicae]